MGCSGSSSLKPATLQAESLSRIVAVGGKCLSTKNITSCGGLDSSVSPRIDLLDSAKKSAVLVPRAAALPVVQEVVSPKLEEVALPVNGQVGDKRVGQAFNIRRIQVLAQPPELQTERHRHTQRQSPKAGREPPDASSVFCLEDTERAKAARQPAAGLQAKEQVSQSAISQKPRRVNTATSLLQKVGNPERRSSTFFASHQDLLKLKHRMASKRDIPQVSDGAKLPPLGPPASRVNILEHLSGSHLDHCEVRSERLRPSRKPAAGLRPKKLLKKSSTSRWPRQPTFELFSGNPSANSSLFAEDRVQSARLPPSARSSHVDSSEQDLSLGAYLSHLQKLKRQTSSRNVLSFAREDFLPSADEQSDTSVREAPPQTGLKKSIFSQQAQPASPPRPPPRLEPTEGRHKHSLFKLALEKNASRGEPGLLAEPTVGLLQRTPPRAESRGQARFASDRSEDLESLGVRPGAHLSAEADCRAHRPSTGRSNSADSQISDIPAPLPPVLPNHSSFDRNTPHGALDSADSSDSAPGPPETSRPGPQPGASARREVPGTPHRPVLANQEKHPVAPQNSARTRKTFQLLSRDCRNLVPEI